MQLSGWDWGSISMRKDNQFLWMLVVLVVPLLFLTGCGTEFRARSADRLPEGCTESSFNLNGLTRWYRICAPEYLPEEAPLVLYLHGGTLSMRSIFSPFVDSSQTWLQITNENNVILLVPNGTNPENGDTYGDDQVWNDLRPDQAAGQTQVDDVGFLLALLDKVSTELPVDQDQIYITGASNGGMMTYRMLQETPERFAAGAVFIANLPKLAAPLPFPSQPVPIMIANGTEDPLMPYQGGVVARNRGEVISTSETVDWWVQANHASTAGFTSRNLPDLDPADSCRIQERIYPGSVGGAEVRLYTISGGGHTLPIKGDPVWFERLTARLLGPICRDADGIMLAWDFFEEVSSSSLPQSP